MMDVLRLVGRELVEPSRIIAVLLIAGTAMLLSRKHRGKSVWIFVPAVLTYVVFGTGPVAYWLMGSLEFRYPPYVEQAGYRDVEHIVLLSGYAGRDNDMPLSSHVNDSSAIRILEAARIFRMQPGRTILVSGYDDVSRVIKDVLVSLGVPEDSVMTEGRSSTTSESAANLSSRLKGKRVILVTSAGHMRRAVGAFEKSGIRPIPAPTDFMTRRNYLASGILPQPAYLRISDLAVHEYAGILWYMGGR